jgi:predicted alpha/beta-hydrolase family hydrolase
LLVSAIRQFAESRIDPPVRGFLHEPESPNGKGFVLTHGAGGNAAGSWLGALADAFCAAGFTVLRCNLPYRQVRSFGPPRPGDAARDRAGLKNAVAEMKKMVTGSVILGGHSYGGRQASMLCAEEPDLAASLLLSSYPLHPPGKPERARTQHLPNLRTPTLFVQGTKDPFATIEEIENARKLIPAKTSLLVVEGEGHDLGFKRKARNDALAAHVLTELQKLEGRM